MSIFIKNIEAPINCMECPFVNEKHCCSCITDRDQVCAFQNIAERPPFCPIVEGEYGTYDN